MESLFSGLIVCIILTLVGPCPANLYSRKFLFHLKWIGGKNIRARDGTRELLKKKT